MTKAVERYDAGDREGLHYALDAMIPFVDPARLTL
jgi:hypothetical protein